MMKLLIPILGIGAIGGGLFLHWIMTGPRCRFGDRTCRALVVGDSIVAAGHFTRMLDADLDRYTFDIDGQVGAGTARILTNMQASISRGGPYDEIIVEGGANDLGQDDDFIVSGVERLVKSARQSGARVVLLSLPPWEQAAARIRQLNKRIRRESMFWGVGAYVDIWTPLADSNGALKAELIGDAAMHIHPNTEGHRLIAQAIRKAAY